MNGIHADESCVSFWLKLHVQSKMEVKSYFAD